MVKYFSHFMRQKLGLEPSGIEEMLKQMKEEVDSLEERISQAKNELNSALERISREYETASPSERRVYDSYRRTAEQMLAKLQSLQNALVELQKGQEASYGKTVKELEKIGEETAKNSPGVQELAERIRKNSAEANSAAEENYRRDLESAEKISKSISFGKKKTLP